MEPNLPPEVLEHIFKQYPKLLLKSRTLSSPMLNLMLPEYSKLKLSKPITYHEIKDYLNTEPDTFAYFQLILLEKEYLKTLYSFLFYNKIRTKWYHELIGDAYVTSHYSNHFYSSPSSLSREGTLFISEFDFVNIIEFDLLTIYNIYKERLLFNKYSKTYAKNKILQHFNYIVTTGYLTWSKLEILSILMLNLYLIINAYILGLIQIDELDKFKVSIPYYQLQFDVNGNIISFQLNPPNIISRPEVKISNINQKLINDIRQRILILD